MGDTKLYLRPHGFLYGEAAHAAVAEGVALPLAGSSIAFTAAQLIEGAPRTSKRRIVSASELAASHDTDLKVLLKRITAPRAPFAGLAMDKPVLMGIVNVT